MRRKILLQLVVPLLCLCVLFLLLATAPAESEQPQELVELSVLFREDSSVWATTRAGMEQAADDLGAELRFMAPFHANDGEEQRELLERELDGGTDGVILVPTDRELLDGVSLPFGTVIVTLETDLSDCGAKACIGVDNQALGEALGRSALNGVPAGGTVLLLDSTVGDNGVRDRMEAARALLEQEGRQVRVCCAADDQELGRQLVEEIRARSSDAMLAFESSALETAAEAVRSMHAEAIRTWEFPPLLYGTGSTPAIAAGLEQSRITAVQAHDEFSAGYLAVVTAVQARHHESIRVPGPLPFLLVRKENMYETDRQKLMFPVAR